jgi:PIN domain nuclease of toxin-antitoxin system
MTAGQDILLLDTHVWLWFALGNADRLGADARRQIEDAALGGKLAVSAITVWEIGMLDVKGRITLGAPCEKWIENALKLPGLRLIGLDPEIAIASTRLPGEFHPDPADRILVATARALNATLATADERIIGYGRAGYLKILDMANQKKA